MHRTDLERQLRAQAAWMRRVLAETAEHLSVPWKFRVVRGTVATELLAAGADADLLILGKVGRSFLQRHRIGSTVRTLIFKRPGLTMVLHETRRRHVKGPVAVTVLYDGSELSRKALHAGMNLVDEKDAPLEMIILADDEDQAVRLKEALEREFRLEGIKAVMHAMIDPDLEKLADVVQRQSQGPVVIPCNDHLLGGEALCALMQRIRNPVLVVRP
jgi:hypothetical protein